MHISHSLSENQTDNLHTSTMWSRRLKKAVTDVWTKEGPNSQQSQNAQKTSAVRSWSAERDRDACATCEGCAGVVSWWVAHLVAPGCFGGNLGHVICAHTLPWCTAWWLPSQTHTCIGLEMRTASAQKSLHTLTIKRVRKHQADILASKLSSALHHCLLGSSLNSEHWHLKHSRSTNIKAQQM